jgi:hypothetical protein
MSMRAEERLDRMLDEALEMTFPASDPFTVYIAETDIAEDGAFHRDEEAKAFRMAA